MFNVKNLLEEHGHTVIPFSIHSNRNVPTEYAKYFAEPIGGRDATYYEDYRKTPKTILKMLSRSIWSPEVKRAIQREIREVKPDVVYTIHFVNKLSPSVLKGAAQMGVPVVSRLSDYFLLCPRFDFLCDRKICEDCLTQGYRSCIRKRCVKHSLSASLIRVISMKIHDRIHIYDCVDAFVAPSEFMKRKLSEHGFEAERIHCIPTFAAPVRKNEEAPAREGAGPSEPASGGYGLYFGRIAEEKGVDTVVKACEKLPDHTVKIMGDDTTEEAVRLKEYGKEHHLTNLEFLGFQSGDALETVIEGARYVMIPSVWYDNLPNTALEAFRHAKPVIASRIGSLPELVEDGRNGYLFEAGNADQLAERIRLLDDDGRVREMGAAGLRLLEERFSAEKHYEALIHVFEEAVRGKAGPRS